jgi:hypothetical protein
LDSGLSANSTIIQAIVNRNSSPEPCNSYIPYLFFNIAIGKTVKKWIT